MFFSLESLVLSELSRFLFFHDGENVTCPLGREGIVTGCVTAEREMYGTGEEKGGRGMEARDTHKAVPWQKTGAQRACQEGFV